VKLTRKIPRLTLDEVDLSNGYGIEVGIQHLVGKVMSYQLLISGVESKTWGQFHLPSPRSLAYYATTNCMHTIIIRKGVKKKKREKNKYQSQTKKQQL